MRLGVICASQSPARTGQPIADWIAAQAREREVFDVDPINLRDVGLPFFDEPELPRFGTYVHAHTLAWAQRVAACGAFVVVSPEYNHSYPAILKNAFDFLHGEWAVKPLGIVSYGGGVSAGLRGAEAIRTLAATLQMYPLTEQVMIPYAAKVLREGRFEPTTEMTVAAGAMLDALARIAPSMQAYRERAQ